jgi:3-hydroxybutyryl-CoA dehydrogenase
MSGANASPTGRSHQETAIQKVGVLGCGLMGSGIAQVSATAGYPTVVKEVADDFLKKGIGAIEKSLAKFVEKGTLTPEKRSETLGRLKGTTKFEDLADCDIVIEAITENLATKRETFATIDKIAKPGAIFASNTSSLVITEMMTATKRVDRFIGMHFFNPVPLMKLVEVVSTITTSPDVLEEAMKFGASLGKVPIRTSDRSGFIVNRLLVPYLLDAVRALEEGVGTVEDIDKGMKLGCGYPMGPFILLDFVGLETTYYIANIMFEEFREKRFAPPPLLKRLVLAGHHGRKTGRGFYDYSDPANPKALF